MTNPKLAPHGATAYVSDSRMEQLDPELVKSFLYFANGWFEGDANRAFRFLLWLNAIQDSSLRVVHREGFKGYERMIAERRRRAAGLRKESMQDGRRRPEMGNADTDVSAYEGAEAVHDAPGGA